MAILTVGRVGLETVDLNHPAELTESRSIDSREFSLRGFLKSTSLVNTKYLKKELLEQQGQIVAVTYTGDSDFDAFYLLSDVQIESMPTSYRGGGLFLFDITLFRIGGSARTEFQSNLTGTVLTNSNGLIEAEVLPWVAPPVSSNVFDWNVTGLTNITRPTEDGNIEVYTATGFDDPFYDAAWGCLPGAFYGGACKLKVSGSVRTGLDIPQDPGDWEISNGILRVKPDAGDSKLDIAVWDGASAYESEKTWKFTLDAGALGTFSYVTAVRNDPEAVILRVMTGGTLARHTIDIHLRRGSPQAYINWFYTGTAGTLKIVGNGTEAATALTPTGAASTVGCYATGNDGGGNRFTIFSASTITNDLTEGGLSAASATRLNAAVGFEIDGTTAQAGDTADDLALQYFGMVGEKVRAVWR